MIRADASTGSSDTPLAVAAASSATGEALAREPELRGRSWGGTLRVFGLLARMTARTKLAFGLRTTTALLGANLLGYSIFMLVWLDVIRSQPGTPTEQAFLRGYLLAALALNTTFTLGVEARCWQRISRGLIGVELLRPIGFQPNQLAQAVGDVLVNVVYAAPAYALGWWWVGGTSLFQTEHPFSTLASIVLAFLVNFGISYIFVLIGLVTHSSYGLMNTRLALHQSLSGFVAPLSMFPEPLREVAARLPFRHAVETPLLIALGGVPSEAVADLLIQQAAWAVALLGFGAAVFQRAMQWEQHDGG
jgi:viologen exporter family transport system permease protein